MNRLVELQPAHPPDSVKPGGEKQVWVTLDRKIKFVFSGIKPEGDMATGSVSQIPPIRPASTSSLIWLSLGLIPNLTRMEIGLVLG